MVSALRQSLALFASGLLLMTTASPAHAQIAMDSGGSSGEANQQRPGIAAGGSNYFVTWTEDDGVYGRRLSFDGSILDERGTLLRGWKNEPPSPFSPPVPSASIIFDGSSYIVAVSASGYADYTPADTSIAIVRIDPATGARMASTAVCGNGMRLARSGSATIAVWVDCSGSIDIASLDANGSLARGYVTLATYVTYGDPIGTTPAVAWNCSEWLVTWDEKIGLVYSSPFVHTDFITNAVRGIRLTDSLTPIDRQPILIPFEGFRVNDESSHLASDGNDFLYAWSSALSTHVRRISATGIPLDGVTLARGVVQDLVWDGEAYSLAYSTLTIPADLGLLRLRPNGQPFQSLAISNTPDDEPSASLTSLGDGRTLAAYTRIGQSPGTGVERLFVGKPRPARGRAAQTGN
jgi:hypothetical protein